MIADAAPLEPEWLGDAPAIVLEGDELTGEVVDLFPDKPAAGPLAAALALVAQGFPVVPLHTPAGDACDCRKRDCDSPAKHPRTMHGLTDATTDEGQVRRWWGMWPTANVGLVIPPGFVALDFDVEEASAVLDGRPLPMTATSRTGRGWHFLYRTAEPIAPKVGILPHLDLRGPGSYIVAPPSRHVSGAVYTWIVPPDPEEIADVPAWVLELARGTGITVTPGRAEPIGETIPDGERNATLASLAGTMRRRDMSAEAITAALLATNAERCRPPLPESEVRTIAASVARYAPAEAEKHSREGDVPSARTNTEAPEGLHFRSAAELTATEGTAVRWALRPWFAFASTAELDGRAKAAGKTTFLLEAIRSLLTGTPFLGEVPDDPGPVVMLSEQPGASFREALARAGLAGRDDLSILLWAESRGIPWPTVVAAAVDECRRIGARVLVVDTLPQWAGVRGDAENNAGDALEAIEPLQVAAARDGLAVIVARHERKGGGEVGDSGRGSSAYTGAVDIVLQLRRRPNAPRKTIRDLVALSRFDETPDEIVIELTSAGFVSLGSGEAIALEEAKAAILHALTTSADPLSVKPDLIERTGAPERTVRDALAILLDTGAVTRSGNGRKGSPYVHSIGSADPGIHSRAPLGGAPANETAEEDPAPFDLWPNDAPRTERAESFRRIDEALGAAE